MGNLYLFDCFGVVVSDVSRLWMEKHFTAKQQNYIRKNVFRKVDRGKMTFDDSFDILASMSGLSKQQVRQEWDSCMYLMEGMPQLLEKVRSKGKVALLSNASESYINQLFCQYDLFKYFDKLFVSSCYGCAKPDREIYRICVNGFAEKFDNIYFVDDNLVNLRGLKKFGITPVLFTDVDSLQKRYGV